MVHLIPLIENADWQTVWPSWQTDFLSLENQLHVMALFPVAASCSILLADDITLHELNRTFRGKDQPTNVLSFPDGSTDSTGQQYLGDLALALETIRREATEQHKPLIHHAQHMLVHGVLHLLGYTHDDESTAHEMESLERAVLAAVGIPDPYGFEGDLS
jgi:probable rRNA maturation factor